MSKVIAIENIEPEMVLAEPVINRHGQTLLPAGASIVKNHTRILKSWNVKFITIKELEDDTEYITVSPELIKIIKNDVDKRMTWTPDNNFEMDIYRACITYLAKNRK